MQLFLASFVMHQNDNTDRKKSFAAVSYSPNYYRIQGLLHLIFAFESNFYKHADCFGTCQFATSKVNSHIDSFNCVTCLEWLLLKNLPFELIGASMFHKPAQN